MDADGSRQIQSVFMTADAVGGVWTYALTLAKALGNWGISVYLATMGPRPSEEQRAAARRIGNVLLFESDYRLEWMDDPWEDVRRAGDWLLNLESQLNPDVIHVNGYAHAALAWKRPAVCVGHSCVLSWWRAVKGETAPPSWSRYRHEVTRGLARADLVIAPSRAMLAELNQLYGPLRSSWVVSNGCEPSEFQPGTKEAIVFCAGRVWDHAKNVRLLDTAAAGISWPVYVGGDGFAGGATHGLGRLSKEQMRDWYGRAAIYALPARYEPFGLSVLEAALSECALVLGGIPSLRENWDNAAVFIPVDDPDSLRHALEMLIHDNELRLEMAMRARRRALQFATERMASGYMDAYRRVTRAGQVKTCA